MTGRVLLLVDVSYQCYRACAVHPLLKDCDDNFTGGVYGWFMNLCKAIRETEATDLVLCLDSKPYVRSLSYPQYKLLRKKAADPVLAERVVDQKPKILAAMAALGWDGWGIPGFESDDLIGLSVLGNRHRFARIFAMSNDSDLYQLFDVARNFAVYSKDIGSVWNSSRLRRELGVTADNFALATALMGTHNDIEGIPQVGLGRAVQAVNSEALMRKYRASHADVIDRNRALIQLPHAELLKMSPRPSWPTPRLGGHRRQLYAALSKFDIEVTAAMVSAFDHLWSQV